MEKPKHHIFVCASFRANGEAQGVCSRKGSIQYLQYLQEELSVRGMEDVAVSMTGCLQLCDHGPVMIVYPENYWYGKVEGEDAIDDILDALSRGKAAEKYLIS
ncbi:MAG: (2Fe-2S) ferredoxin domain-containing protein [Candidatus Omnitrophota bacterium]|jgi:(2Fe-2S) ferredoxin